MTALLRRILGWLARRPAHTPAEGAYCAAWTRLHRDLNALERSTGDLRAAAKQPIDRQMIDYLKEQLHDGADH